MMTKAIGIGLFVAIVSVGGTLYAGDEVDCSRLDTYADGHTYNKGDLVYWKNGAAAGAETAARTFIAVRPASGWEKLAECRIGTQK
jgi:hypothetical protein